MEAVQPGSDWFRKEEKSRDGLRGNREGRNEPEGVQE
jgi:hypothetical protein